MLDIFRSDAFSTVSLTDAILKQPHTPGRIGSLGLFRSRGITTTTVVVEEVDGRLSLIETSPRGGVGETIGRNRRTVRSFVVPHLERYGKVMADQVQNIRAFGSEDNTQAVQTLVNEELADLRRMHDVTLEYHRIGAIKGQILDSDGSSTVYDLFTEFGVSQQVHTVDFSNANLDVRTEAVRVQRLIETEVGAEVITGYRAFCGDSFFDEFIGHPKVHTSIQYQDSELMRRDLRAGFEYGGITWENYRGRVGAIDFIPADEAFVVPLGTSYFATYFAPADFIETVNTVGVPMYAKLVNDPELNRHVKIHTQSNPLCLCLRPRVVVRLTMNT